MNFSDEERDKLAAVAIIMLSRELGRLHTLNDGVDMAESGAYNASEAFTNFVRNDLAVGVEYGAQVMVQSRVLKELDVAFSPQFDPSMRGWELNAVIERRA